MDNAELAYLLGMITGKGTIIRSNTQTDIIIEIPHKNLQIEGMETTLSVRASLDEIRNIIEPLIGTRLISSPEKHKTTIKFTKDNDDFLIREISRHFQRLNSAKDFRIPEEIFSSPTDIKSEFMIGLSDVTAHIRSSNIAYGIPFNHRTYVEIPVNWFLVVDIGNLLFDLDVPVHNINWAHPNMRDPKLKYYNNGQTMSWFKEHQIKIFADEFERIGFRIIHKRRAIQKFAQKNREEWDRDIQTKIDTSESEIKKDQYRQKLGQIDLFHHKFYWQTKEIDRPKQRHPMEDNENIPEIIRGQHFDSWKQISRILGYPRREVNNE
jgi:hypothetical protein